jgi:hypothetical protein
VTRPAERRATRILDVQRQRQATALSDLKRLLQRKFDVEQRSLEMDVAYSSVDALGQRFSDIALRYMATTERMLLEITAEIAVQRAEYQKRVLAVQLAERWLRAARDTAMRKAEQQKGAEFVQLHVIRCAARSR